MQQPSPTLVSRGAADDGEEPGAQRRATVETGTAVENLEGHGLQHLLGGAVVPPAAVHGPGEGIFVAGRELVAQCLCVHGGDASLLGRGRQWYWSREVRLHMTRRCLEPAGAAVAINSFSFLARMAERVPSVADRPPRCRSAPTCATSSSSTFRTG